MKKPYFDNELGCDVLEFDNITQASEVLAKQLHEEAVGNNENIDSDWDNRGYRNALINEALIVLKEQGHGPVPTLDGHKYIKLINSSIEEIV